MALLNHKNGICAYGKREFYTYVKCISRVRMEFFLVACVLHLTRHSSLTQLAQKFSAWTISTKWGFCGKQSHEIGPWYIELKFSCMPNWFLIKLIMNAFAFWSEMNQRVWTYQNHKILIWERTVGKMSMARGSWGFI